MTETHPAIKFIQVGRGYGITRVPVVDFARLSVTAKTLHAMHQSKPVCGTNGRPIQVFRECDPKAIVVSGQPVCIRCQDALGHVPMPELLREGECQ